MSQIIDKEGSYGRYFQDTNKKWISVKYVGGKKLVAPRIKFGWKTPLKEVCKAFLEKNEIGGEEETAAYFVYAGEKLNLEKSARENGVFQDMTVYLHLEEDNQLFLD